MRIEDYGPANERLKDAALRSSTELLVCPYDKSHRILPTKMQIHLKKCAVQNIHKKGLIICDYNFTHHIAPEAIEAHLLNCPDRCKAENVVKDLERSKNETPMIQPSLVPEGEENWDNEDSPTYDPFRSKANEAMFRCLKGAPKSLRRQFQNQQRIRNNRLLSGGNMNLPSTSGTHY